MSKKLKLTPWFPGHVKPVRDGVYEATHWGLACLQHWNGTYWGRPGWSAKEATDNGGDKYCYQNMEWRGLAVKP